MKYTEEQIKFLETFFDENMQMLMQKDMLDPEEMKTFMVLYANYLEDSNMKGDAVCAGFLTGLQRSYDYEQGVKSGRILLTPKERMKREAKHAYSSTLQCKNPTILKYYDISTIVKQVSRADVEALNRRMEAITRQNASQIRLTRRDLNRRVGGVLPD